MHSEDTTKSLNVLHEWIREIIDNGTSVNQDILLTELNCALLNYFDKNKKYSELLNNTNTDQDGLNINNNNDNLSKEGQKINSSNNSSSSNNGNKKRKSRSKGYTKSKSDIPLPKLSFVAINIILKAIKQ